MFSRVGVCIPLLLLVLSLELFVVLLQTGLDRLNLITRDKKVVTGINTGNFSQRCSKIFVCVHCISSSLFSIRDRRNWRCL